MPEAEMWILGSGTEAPALTALAARHGLSSKIKLIGQVPASDIPGWLRKADVGILPIRRDVFLDFAFPNKLPEFIVAGKPVLISRLKAIRHYFSEESLAFFEPNNPLDLAKQMLNLYGNRLLRQRLVANARDEYAGIRWDLMKQRYLELVDHVSLEIDSAALPREAAVIGSIAQRKRTSL
jgi:glycosyltransferase involved in cell wall biosynthesis